MRSATCSRCATRCTARPTDAKGFYAVYAGLIVVAAALVLTPGTPLGLLTNAVQTLAGVLLPSATVFLLLLCNDKAVLGPWVNGRWLNLFTGAVIAVLVMLSVILTASVLFPDADRRDGDPRRSSAAAARRRSCVAALAIVARCGAIGERDGRGDGRRASRDAGACRRLPSLPPAKLSRRRQSLDGRAARSISSSPAAWCCPHRHAGDRPRLNCFPRRSGAGGVPERDDHVRSRQGRGAPSARARRGCHALHCTTFDPAAFVNTAVCLLAAFALGALIGNATSGNIAS